MCYVNGIKVSKAELIAIKDMEIRVNKITRKVQSGFDYSDWPIVKPIYDGAGLDMTLAHWELIPFWINDEVSLKESRKKYTTLNATCENLLTSKIYKEAALKRRCLVLSSGFYEWRHFKPAGAKKEIAYPYYITTNEKRDFFWMAGIWQSWTDKQTGEVMDTFAIITRPANVLMTSVHNSKKRMPVILEDDEAYKWLTPNLTNDEIMNIANFEYKTENMKAYTVRKDFKSLEEPTEAFVYDELPPLDENI